MHELPFKFFKGKEFCYFISILQPKFSIMGMISIARDCWSIYLNKNHFLKHMFSHSN